MTSTDGIPHREDWEEHYPTETAYGRTYPAPADWVFSDFERGGQFLSLFDRVAEPEERVTTNS